MIPIIGQIVADQTYSIQFTLTDVITWIIIGLIAGFLARLLVRGSAFSMEQNLIIGLIGAFVGGLLFSILRIPSPGFLSGGIVLSYFDILVAFIGAVLVLLVTGIFYHRYPYRRRYYRREEPPPP